MLIFFAIILWLIVNYFTGGLYFSALLCIFAGLFLVMPGLINFDFKDFSLIKKEKNLTTLNILLNVIIIPMLLVISGIIFFPHNREIRYTLAMLWILPGWGLLMSWIRQSKANGKYGFTLFVLNMTVFVILFFLVNYLILHNFNDQTIITQSSCELETATKGIVSCVTGGANSKPILAYLFLVLIPFGISRLIRMFSSIKKNIQKYIPLVSKIATFLIILYIFSLQNIHWIFNQNILMVLKIFVMVLVGYLMVFWLTYTIYRKQKEKSDITKSFFWNSTIRFVTLGVVFGILYVPYLGVTYITIFASAYMIQTVLSTLSLKLLK